MPVIKSISCRAVLNSHVEFTNEFRLELDSGASGVGASPKGETISSYEAQKAAFSPEAMIRRLHQEGLTGRPLDQAQFDAWLKTHAAEFGRNNSFSLSLAFFEATAASGWNPWGGTTRPPKVPRLCCNILNGGWHAYTNPVLSDFPEYLLVAKTDHVEETIHLHNELQARVREELNRWPRTVIAGNPVHCFPTADNRECLDFLLTLENKLGMANKFELMLDASAGDLWTEKGYRLSITDHSVYSSEDFCQYWLGLAGDYKVRFLEDPLGEQDAQHWQQLTGAARGFSVFGDNFYCSDPERIQDGAARKCTHGVIIKPNQAGTVTAARRAIEVAREWGQIPITSHRSISTEETFLATLTCQEQIPYLKVGPLFTDFSAVLRLNTILRLVEQPTCQLLPSSAPSATPTPSITPSGATPGPATSL